MDSTTVAEMTAELATPVIIPDASSSGQQQGQSLHHSLTTQNGTEIDSGKRESTSSSVPDPPAPERVYATNTLPEYTFDPTLTIDENFISWCLIYSRLSMSKRGNMATIITEPKRDNLHSHENPPAVLGHSNNYPLLSPASRNGKHAEIHAEARAICIAAKQGKPIEGATIYVTFPPCSACFQLIVASGIKRCVYRRWQLSEEAILQAVDAGVETVEFTDFDQDERLKLLVDKWFAEHGEKREASRARSERWWVESKQRLREVTTLATEKGMLSNREIMQDQRKARKRANAAASRSSQVNGVQDESQDATVDENELDTEPPIKRSKSEIAE